MEPALPRVAPERYDRWNTVNTCFGVPDKNSFAPTAKTPEVTVVGGMKARQGEGPLRRAACRPPPVLGSYRITHTALQNAPINKWRLIRDFRNYIATTAKCKFRVYSTVECYGHPLDDAAVSELGYIHRWTPVYRSAVIAKFYLLEAYARSHPTRYTMMTLTTAQDGDYSVSMRGEVTTIEDSFELLKKGFDRVTKWLRKHHPGLEYVWMMEPHKTGYPHMHVVLFGTLPESSQEAIRQLWSHKYCIGSYENGVKFTTPPINSIRNYRVKYIRKTLHGGKTGSKYEASTEGWTQGELLFNAVMWYHGWRLWGASRTLSKAMARPPASSEDMDNEGTSREWQKTVLVDENGDEHEIKHRASPERETMVSDTDKKMILDGRCPVTKMACPDDCPIVPARGVPARCPAYYQTVHPMSDEMRQRYERDAP